MRIPSSLRSPAFLALACCAALAFGVDAASTSFWQVSTQAEFLKGEVEHVSIDSDGRVSLGPALEQVQDAGAPAVWRLLVDPDDTVWAGTGNDGRVWRIGRDGKPVLAYDAPELEVHAIAAAPGGGVFAGSSPDGKVYRIARDGGATPFFDPEDKYIWSLAVGPDGTLYVGAGEKGRIYKVDREGKGTLFYDTETTHVTSLTWDPRGALLVGTASPGRVLRLDPSGTAFVLLESAYKEIRGVRIAPDGQVYVTAVGVASGSADTPVKSTPDTPTPTTPIPTVSTEITVSAIGDTTVVTPSTSGLVSDTRSGGMQKGAVYRIAPDGEWTIVWESPDDIPYDVAVEPSGALLIATGSKGKLYRLSGNPTLTTLVTRAEAQQITAFAQDRGGRLLLATANPGRILRIASTQTLKGTYLSEVKDTATVATWGALRWRASVGDGASVELFTRSGNTRAPDKTWSPWSKAYTRDGAVIESPKARYLQWKAVLSRSGAGTPAPLLTSVTAAFLPRNTRPVVDSITVHPAGVVFQRPYPTGDPELAGFDANTADGRQSMSPAAAVSAPGPALGRRGFQKSLQTFVWQARDNDGDRLQFDVYYRLEGDPTWRVLKRALFDEIYTWDTTSVPDGAYVIKVVASDSPANAPPTALQGERESNTFDIDNTPPVIEVPRDARATPNLVTFSVRDGHSPIQRVEYSFNAGRWNLAYPVDGLLDSREERFELRLDPTEQPSANGGGAVVLRVTDALGNVATSVIGR